MITEGMAILFLFTEAIEDVKYRALKLWRLVVWGILAAVVKYLFIRQNVDMFLGEMVMGMLVLFVCRISNEAIGFGDGAVILVMAIMCGVERTLVSCLLALSVFLAAGIVVMMKKGFKRNISLPFIPFLFLGYIGGLFL